jgi:hypothetical protein
VRAFLALVLGLTVDTAWIGAFLTLLAFTVEGKSEVAFAALAVGVT